jgi:hypothetical protein
MYYYHRVDTCVDWLKMYYYHWVDTLIINAREEHPPNSVLALKWFNGYIYHWNLLVLNNVIIIKTNGITFSGICDLSQSGFGYHV